MTLKDDTGLKNGRPTLERRKGWNMHSTHLRLAEITAKQEALLLEAERNRLIGLARVPRPVWTLSGLLRKPRLKTVKA